MCNNDTLLLQDNFCNLVIKEYKKSGFAILGPKIYLPKGNVCKYRTSIETIDEIKEEIKHIKNSLIKLNIPGYNILHFIKKNCLYLKKNCKNLLKHDENYFVRKENVVLNGSFIIFSKKYTNYFKGLDKRTFLYYEEQLLYLRIKSKDLISIYNPKIEILHNEGVSTKKSFVDKKKKRIFIKKNLLKSAEILLSELELLEENK